jgi:hypothetical protein
MLSQRAPMNALGATFGLGVISGPSCDSSPDAAQSESVQRLCQWGDCSLFFSRTGQLFSHLCNDHIGKRTSNNICLTCKWKDCGRFFAERDDITDHCRTTHVQRSGLQPELHLCEVCRRLPQHPIWINIHTSPFHRFVIKSSNESLI